MSRPLGHTWVGRQLSSDCATGLPLRVSVGQMFFSDIAVQLLTSKLMCFSSRINSRAVDIPYSSKDMPKVKQENYRLYKLRGLEANPQVDATVLLTLLHPYYSL